MGPLSDLVALVTGGAQGIGRAYSLGLASEGAVVVVADIQDGSAVVDEIIAGGGTALWQRVDVSDRTSTEEMAGTAVDQLGRVDVLINNAGFFRSATIGPFAEISDEEWDLAFKVNVRGVWHCCRAVYPYMKRQGSGKIINISSTVAWEGIPGFLHYVASKSALIGLTRALAREVGGDGITVNTLVPGLIPDAESTSNPREAQDGWSKRAEETNKLVVAQRCIQRTQVQEDMVGAAVFLSGAGSDFITGQTLVVDGGVMFL